MMRGILNALHVHTPDARAFPSFLEDCNKAHYLLEDSFMGRHTFALMSACGTTSLGISS